MSSFVRKKKRIAIFTVNLNTVKGCIFKSLSLAFYLLFCYIWATVNLAKQSNQNFEKPLHVKILFPNDTSS